MDYREFMTKLGEVYTLKKGVVDIYNEAFKDKTEFSSYWQKFTREYTSLNTPPAPSFWLKDETPIPKRDDRNEKEYLQAEETKKRLQQEMLRKWGA